MCVWVGGWMETSVSVSLFYRCHIGIKKLLSIIEAAKQVCKEIHVQTAVPINFKYTNQKSLYLYFKYLCIKIQLYLNVCLVSLI